MSCFRNRKNLFSKLLPTQKTASGLFENTNQSCNGTFRQLRFHFCFRGQNEKHQEDQDPQQRQNQAAQRFNFFSISVIRPLSMWNTDPVFAQPTNWPKKSPPLADLMRLIFRTHKWSLEVKNGLLDFVGFSGFIFFPQDWLNQHANVLGRGLLRFPAFLRRETLNYGTNFLGILASHSGEPCKLFTYFGHLGLDSLCL